MYDGFIVMDSQKSNSGTESADYDNFVAFGSYEFVLWNDVIQL